MATINEVIERVSRLRPVQALDDADMAKWLLELEGRMWNVLVETSVIPWREEQPEEPEEVGQQEIPMVPLTPAWPPAERARIWPEDGDKPLLAPAPYDRVYDYWLISNIEFALREYTNYQNTYQMFNEAYQEFSAWFRRQFRTRTDHGFVHVFP